MQPTLQLSRHPNVNQTLTRIIMKKFLGYLPILLIVILNSATSWGQATSEEWRLIHEENGVKFFGKEIYCSNFSEEKPSYYAFLKIENSNAQSVHLNYSLGLQFTEGCSGCNDNSEFTAVIDIPAGSTVEADCSFSQPALSRIIRNLNLVGGWEYHSMRIVNLIID